MWGIWDYAWQVRGLEFGVWGLEGVWSEESVSGVIPTSGVQVGAFLVSETTAWPWI